MALDFTLRHARQAKTRSASVSGSAGAPLASVQVSGSSPGASMRVPGLGQDSAGDAAELDRVRHGRRRHAQQAKVEPPPLDVRAAQDRQRVVGEVRREHHLGEDVGDLFGQRRR